MAQGDATGGEIAKRHFARGGLHPYHDSKMPKNSAHNCRDEAKVALHMAASDARKENKSSLVEKLEANIGEIDVFRV